MKALLFVGLMAFPIQDSSITIKASTMQAVFEAMDALDKVNKDQDDEIKALRKALEARQACA